MTVERIGDATNGVVILDYEDLKNGKDLSQSIEAAYGYNGLGLLVVRNVPGYQERRQRLLPLAYKFGNFPEEIKNKYVHQESAYSFGWSHGKEKLNGKPDSAKGSFYANPQYDNPTNDPELVKKYPSFCHPNIWPKEDLPDLEYAFKELGQLIVGVGELLSAQCDKHVKKTSKAYGENRLRDIIHSSRVCKARLLLYFPCKDEDLIQLAATSDSDTIASSWCGWHNDHGSLTGLTSAMYFDKDGKEVPCPDPSAGLYIKDRNGNVVRGSIPADCIAYQIGETAQIHSGGVLQATPHCVRAAGGLKSAGVSRGTFAVFMEPEWHESMAIPADTKVESVLEGSSSKHLPPGVPALSTRWEPTQDFGQFTDKTLSSYY
eukprot:Colp12_sorted_trinity150504_noHs@30867